MRVAKSVAKRYVSGEISMTVPALEGVVPSGNWAFCCAAALDLDLMAR